MQQAWKAFQPQSANQVILPRNGNIKVSDKIKLAFSQKNFAFIISIKFHTNLFGKKNL